MNRCTAARSSRRLRLDLRCVPEAIASATQCLTWPSSSWRAGESRAVPDDGDVGEDVDAVAVVVDHPLDAAHLSLDPVQTVHERLLVDGVPGSVTGHS